MFICADCGRAFDEPATYVERHGLEFPPYEEWDGCPYCSGAYVETFTCDMCNDYVVDKYVELSDGTIICDRCYEEKDIFD